MKTIYKIITLVAVLPMLLLTSCLDDEMVGIEVPDFGGTPYTVDFNLKPNSEGFVAVGLPGTTDPAKEYKITLRANLSSPYTLDEDLTLTLAADEQYVLDYIAEKLTDSNAANDGYEALDAAHYTLTTTSVVIPKGEREVEFDVMVKTQPIAVEDSMLIAVSITATSNPNVVISGNFGTQLVRVGVKNVFHGEYTTDNMWRYTWNYVFPNGGTAAYTSNYTDQLIETVSSTISMTHYTYKPWAYPFYFDVDMSSPQTIDGHANAYPVTVTAYRSGAVFADQEQFDLFDGEIYNYAYQNAEGGWIFKICQAITTGSGTHLSRNIYTQNPVVEVK